MQFQTAGCKAVDLLIGAAGDLWGAEAVRRITHLEARLRSCTDTTPGRAMALARAG
jgi:hypothetical protein